MKKTFIIVIVVLVISACANEKIKNSKYKYIKIKDIENAQTIVMSKMADFRDIIEKNKDILLFEKNDVSFFGYKKNETIYLIDNEGYNTIKDYNNGKKEGYKNNRDYYQAEELNCNSSENYYEYKKSMFLSFEDYIEAKENGFLESNFSNINLLYPLKYPEEKNIQIFEEYNQQYNSAFKYKKKTNKIKTTYYLANNNYYYRFVFPIKEYYNTPSFNIHDNYISEDVFYYGKMLGENNPSEVKAYLNKINKDNLSKIYENISFKEKITKNIADLKIETIRSRTADDNPYTVIIDSRIAFLDIPELKKYLLDNEERIVAIIRKYFTSKRSELLTPERENEIKNELVKKINNKLGIEYIEDIVFMQFNVIDF